MSVSVPSAERAAPPSRARAVARAAVRDAGALVVLAALVAAPATRELALVNLAVQAVLFALACVLALRTRVMAVADCAWSWGLLALGVESLWLGHGLSAALVILAGVYVVMGLRMGVHSTLVAARARSGPDLPRYRYRRLLWREEGYRSQPAPMLHDIAIQGVGNASVLATPAILVASDRGAAFVPSLVAGAALWALAWSLELAADVQKARFLRRCGTGRATRTCAAGLWRYSRHPNYFCQWLQWIALVVLAAPSLVHVADRSSALPATGLAAGLLAIPGAMYFALVHFTGAIPAEHYSVQHRPDYPDYQRHVNRFWPGPNRGFPAS